MSASVFGPCTVCGADAAGNKMLCSLDAENVLQKRAVLCPRCRRRLLHPRKRLWRRRPHSSYAPWTLWPHVRARGERVG